MSSPSQNGLYVLCDYGISMSLSAVLMQKYGDEDDIPLNEFDPAEYQSITRM